MSPVPNFAHRRSAARPAAVLLVAVATVAGACRDLPFAPQDPATVAYADTLRINLASYQKTARGVYYRDLAVGSGPLVTDSSTVGLIYRGYLANGYVFNPATTQPVTFDLRTTVPGFRDGLVGARGSSRRLLIVPPALGYGNRTAGNNKIPAGSVLLFDVSIASVTTPTTTPAATTSRARP